MCVCAVFLVCFPEVERWEGGDDCVWGGGNQRVGLVGCQQRGYLFHNIVATPRPRSPGAHFLTSREFLRQEEVVYATQTVPCFCCFFFFLPEAWQNTNGVLGSIVFCRPPTMVRTYHFHTAVHRGGRLRLASICAKRGAGVERTTAALQQAGTSCKRGASGYHDAPL